DLSPGDALELGGSGETERLDRKFGAPSGQKAELAVERRPADEPARSEAFRGPELPEIQGVQLLACVAARRAAPETKAAQGARDRLEDGLVRRLQDEHPVPEVRGDSDHPSLFPGGDVGSLQGFSPVDEARRVRVREQEHGALDTRSQEGRESDLVSVREGLYV